MSPGRAGVPLGMRFFLRGSGPHDSHDAAASCPASRVPRALRWALAGAGLVSMSLGIVGIWVPGLPTTVFLIVASYLFTRSCPPLDRWMRSLGPVQPFVRFLDGDPIPSHIVPLILVLIWGGGTWGAVRAAHPVVSPVIALAIVVGTVFVIRRSAWYALPPSSQN